MNIVDYLILAILGFGLLSGMHKGSITSGLNTLGFVASWFGAQRLYARIANFALSNTTLMAVLNQYLEPEEFFSSAAEATMAVLLRPPTCIGSTRIHGRPRWMA